VINVNIWGGKKTKQKKPLSKVLFARLYLQICIFYQDISISCRSVSSKWVNPNRKYDEKRHNNATFVSYDPAKAKNGFVRSNCTYTREFDVIPPQELLIGQLLRNVRNCDATESKTRHLEKFKINISTHRTQTKFCTRKCLNTKSILHI
jgi:hypothetical protein